MRIAIIGRSEILYDTAIYLCKQGHDIAIIITAKEAPEYTRNSADFQKLAETWGIPFAHTPRIEEAIETIRLLPKIDIGISFNYVSIILQSVIDFFPFGILNAHGGDLPRYRGNACQAWAIINGEERVGLCIHSMIGGEVDNGNIISRDYYPLNINTKITEVWEWMHQRIPELFEDSVAKLMRNPGFVLERQSNNPNDALRCYPRRPDDGKIDWRQSALQIIRLINACNKPYAGAFCEFEGKKIIIWDAGLSPDEKFLAVPGQITCVGNCFVDVATGEGKVRVNLVEISGEVMVPNKVIHSIRQRFF